MNLKIPDPPHLQPHLKKANRPRARRDPYRQLKLKRCEPACRLLTLSLALGFFLTCRGQLKKKLKKKPRCTFISSEALVCLRMRAVKCGGAIFSITYHFSWRRIGRGVVLTSACVNVEDVLNEEALFCNYVLFIIRSTVEMAWKTKTWFGLGVFNSVVYVDLLITNKIAAKTTNNILVIIVIFACTYLSNLCLNCRIKKARRKRGIKKVRFLVCNLLLIQLI